MDFFTQSEQFFSLGMYEEAMHAMAKHIELSTSLQQREFLHLKKTFEYWTQADFVALDAIGAEQETEVTDYLKRVIIDSVEQKMKFTLHLLEDYLLIAQPEVYMKVFYSTFKAYICNMLHEYGFNERNYAGEAKTLLEQAFEQGSELGPTAIPRLEANLEYASLLAKDETKREQAKKILSRTIEEFDNNEEGELRSADEDIARSIIQLIQDKNDSI